LYTRSAVAHALISKIEQWSKEKGMSRLIGSYGFSDKDPQGLQVEGLELLPVIATPTNPAYLQKLLENEGYTKELIVFRIKCPFRKSCHRFIRKFSIGSPPIRTSELLEFTSKRQLKPYIIPVFRLVNETYSPLFGFVPMTEEEMKKFAGSISSCARPRTR
jgi:hypothetical protein